MSRSMRRFSDFMRLRAAPVGAVIIISEREYFRCSPDGTCFVDDCDVQATWICSDVPTVDVDGDKGCLSAFLCEAHGKEVVELVEMEELSRGFAGPMGVVLIELETEDFLTYER